MHIILDLDLTLIYAESIFEREHINNLKSLKIGNRYIYLRPGLELFLKNLYEFQKSYRNISISIWTAGSLSYCIDIIKNILFKYLIKTKYIIARDYKNFKVTTGKTLKYNKFNIKSFNKFKSIPFKYMFLSKNNPCLVKDLCLFKKIFNINEVCILVDDNYCTKSYNGKNKEYFVYQIIPFNIYNKNNDTELNKCYTNLVNFYKNGIKKNYSINTRKKKPKKFLTKKSTLKNIYKYY